MRYQWTFNWNVTVMCNCQKVDEKLFDEFIWLKHFSVSEHPRSWFWWNKSRSRGRCRAETLQHEESTSHCFTEKTCFNVWMWSNAGVHYTIPYTVIRHVIGCCWNDSNDFILTYMFIFGFREDTECFQCPVRSHWCSNQSLQYLWSWSPSLKSSDSSVWLSQSPHLRRVDWLYF